MTFQSGYQSYLIRFQQVHNAQPDDHAAWLISVENIQTGQKLAFDSLHTLFEYLAGCFLPSHVVGGMHSEADESRS